MALQRSLHRPLKTIRHTVDTSWWSGEADIPTYETSELLATKLRALYQRSKGRDLFDLWLGLTVLKTDPDDARTRQPTTQRATGSRDHAPGHKANTDTASRPKPSLIRARQERRLRHD
jgi:predicted nucleotidyltransferase component of viral defense system